MITAFPEIQASQPPSVITEACLHETSKRFQLPKKLLRAVLKIENGQAGELNINANGTYDIGPMQINSIWLPLFEPYISLEEILYNGCSNLQVGAWILRYNINRAGGNFWKGVGNYHSKTAIHNIRYQSKIFQAAHQGS
jgi:soluble lytic murein transglycosylase-like protein